MAASPEHTFYGIWEIVSCMFEGQRESCGLEGMKFRLDDNSDITWYNDLVSPLPDVKTDGNLSALVSVLISCETFEVNAENPHLVFGAFAGHSIEFNTESLMPAQMLVISCENWYTLECKRLNEDQAVDQEREFTFEDALHEAYFSDVIIKSSDGFQYHVHACILRLSGFDCSMCIDSNNSSAFSRNESRTLVTDPYNSLANSKNVIISVTTTRTKQCNTEEENRSKKLSNKYLKPPIDCCHLTDDNSLISLHQQHLSASFNCLSVTKPNSPVETDTNGGENNKNSNRPITSNSDSHLDTHYLQQQNIFNFCPALLQQQQQQQETLEGGHSIMQNIRQSIFNTNRCKTKSAMSSCMDTPPSSPLTPVAVLYDLPSALLTPILHWLYTEALLPDLDEDVCEKLIDFTERQPCLTKMTETFKKYLKLVKLRKFVVNIVMDLHYILDGVIKRINPMSLPHNPLELYETFNDCIKEGFVGCSKVLQFCHIFVKDAADIARYQKNEIIKYIRSRVPIFISQLHQLLDNMLELFACLSHTEKTDLAYFLIPEVECALMTLTNLFEEIGNSLERMCKELKCSHLDLSENHDTDVAVALQIRNKSTAILDDICQLNSLFSRQPLSPKSRKVSPVSLISSDKTTNGKDVMGVENDLKFVLYMYEVRRMRDIYGRITAIVEVLKDKQSIFNGMDHLSKQNTIYENINLLISYIPAYVSILDSLAQRVEEKLSWKEFKFCFKLATSQINGVLVKIIEHKSALKEALIQMCVLVQKQEFTEALQDLGLLELSNANANQYKSLFAQSETATKFDYEHENIKLNLVRHLCQSPISQNSNLSKSALRLLHSGQTTDMEFEIQTITNQGQDQCELDVNTIQLDLCGVHTSKASIQVYSFRAHRVIVSARCEYFKKVLMSGMQESLTGKIVIKDTSPVIFRRLLLYLYGAPIDKTVGAEQICELMMLADRYSIIDLKELCENTLNALIDEDSVLCLLGIADHYMAAALKSKCLSFLAQNSYLIKTTVFKSLNQTLQLEAMDLIRWYGRVAKPWTDDRTQLKLPRTASRSHSRSPAKIKNTTFVKSKNI